MAGKWIKKQIIIKAFIAYVMLRKWRSCFAIKLMHFYFILYLEPMALKTYFFWNALE
jgi:hypothetical protein